MMNKRKFSLNALAISIASATFAIPTYAVSEEVLVEEVVIVGSRGAPRSVTDSPVPVDVINSDELSKTGSSDLLMQLQGAVPSLNVHLQPISDAASMIRPANLRGLPSDNTLVMVNGKRRHRASVIAFLGGGINDGAHGPDISVIPSIALKQVEVLRDGASAQYGSDAIAGVINFILDDSSEGGKLSIKKGEFAEGDGDTTTIAGNIGMPLTDAGFVNMSFQMKQQDATSRSEQRPDAQALIDAGNTSVTDPAQIWGAPIVDDDVTFFLNSGLDLGDGSEAYMFANYSERDVDGGFYYRNPDDRGGVFTYENPIDEGIYRLVADLTGNCASSVDFNICTVDPSDYSQRDALIESPDCYIHNQQAPGGYTPRFTGNITDSAIAMGTRGEFDRGFLKGFNYDISGSVGRNEASFGLNNTFNPSMGPDSPRDFETGTYIQLAKTFNFDLQKQVGNTSLAGGIEWRETTFTVIAGEQASYQVGAYTVSEKDADGNLNIDSYQPFNIGSETFARNATKRSIY